MMEILRVAATETSLFEFGKRSGYVAPEAVFDWKLPKPADELAEAAGRLCYKSFSRPNPETAKTKGYLANIIRQQHFSVLEHASVTYYVSGVSRNLLVELTRHRHLSFSVVSQRYVDHSKASGVVPPAINELPEPDRTQLMYEIQDVQNAALSLYVYVEQELERRGLKKKQIREAARAVLPGMTATEFLVTGNLRTWREVLQKRLSPGADAEIRQLAELLLDDLKSYAPDTFQDFKGA